MEAHNEPRHEKTGLLGFRPGLTQTGLYNNRRLLEASNFGFRKYRDCTIHVAKTKALISCAGSGKQSSLLFPTPKKRGQKP